MDTSVPFYATTLSEYDDFFSRYAQAFERSLNGHVDVDAIREFYAEYFVWVSAGRPAGGGKNDEAFVDSLRQALDFYRQVGMKTMQIEAVAVLQIHDGHDRVRVSYVSRHDKRDGIRLDLRFDVSYLVERRVSGPRIFAIIADDEKEMYYDAGLVDLDGRPL